jgi:hypothetical protein
MDQSTTIWYVDFDLKGIKVDSWVSRCTPTVLLLAYLAASSPTFAGRSGNACGDAEVPHSICRDSLWHCNDTFRLVIGCHVFSIFIYRQVSSYFFYSSIFAYGMASWIVARGQKTTQKCPKAARKLSSKHRLVSKFT